MNQEDAMTEFITVALAHFLALISPGPDFFIIITIALRNGSARAFYTCLGIASANGVYIVFALLGFAVVREHAWLLGVMKVAGAAFLCYLGFMLLRSSQRELYKDADFEQEVDSAKKLFMTGFMSALLNPKNPIFYISLYSLFISRTTGLHVQTLYGIWMFSAVLLWDVFIAYSVGNRRIRELLNAYTHRIEQVSGVVIMTLGILLAVG